MLTKYTTGPPYISHTYLRTCIRSIRTETSTLLLLGDTDGPAAPAGGLGVLAAHADAPVVAEAAVRADLLQALEVLAQLVVQEVGHHLSGLACKWNDKGLDNSMWILYTECRCDT